ncbi:glutathione ABC transporter permease [Pullulanibacillus camelliae]|uniref:Glutathione transport system permease protein GsiC n=1 Tax=Pullulanibacillus camelliae TaxID=1707096 RepID=A0A8J2YEU0_9BACL|nr:ABC transporter permease subunit [Pullulanibacillus camelliae]GGE27436.1 glutathione ABC transporter permease [Pullulanibacillus camelliae]
MKKYIVKRILGIIPLLFVVSFLIFLFIHLVPGDPARLIAGKDADLQQINAIKHQLHLDEPLYKQYIDYMNNLFHGNLGESIKSKVPVSELIGERIVPSLELSLLSIAWAMVIGVLIGIISAIFKNRWPDNIGMITAVSGISLPNFWLGLVMIQIFSVKLGLLPTGGIETWKGYLMPSIALGAGIMAMIARFTRSSLVQTLKEDFIRTGRSRGYSGLTIVFGHALRSSLIPVVTVAGLQFGFLLGGSIVVETVFSFPGMGRLLINSIQMRDYPVVQAELMLFSFEFILVNLIVDLLYGFLNPKIRYD